MRKLKQLRTYEVFLEKNGLGPVAGVDEAGRGSCAGPLTIAACVLPPKVIEELDILTDSKKLSPSKRAELYPLIKKKSLAWSILHITPQFIDCFGIQHANISGMRRAVAQLKITPEYVLTDAMPVEGMPIQMLPMIGGDATARCIAAASVLAKESRDRFMKQLGELHPGYGLEDHKGYGTKLHMDAVRHHGATPVHRYSYANVAKANQEWLDRQGKLIEDY